MIRTNDFVPSNPLSYLKVKRVGKIKEKSTGKEINQEFESKIYSELTGLDAVKELKAMQKEFEDKGQDDLLKEDSPPKTMSKAI